ncbi:MAG: protease [Halobacteriovoraceae bacterium]|nr:protease [Halobacteriovoraceae bacterium]|tara:strand:- start:705 stop:1268 length:564 start_codon:yes stop_codon:yes gene_type:complete
MSKLSGKRIAVLATNGFEHSELFEPHKALKDEGATVDVVSLESGSIKSWKDGDWGEEIKVDKTLSEANADDYDALVLPGGVINPDSLRNNEKAVSFIKSFSKENRIKPIGAICHGPWLLAEAGIAKNRKLTSYGSIKTDMINAGANWVDEEVVVDNGVVTSRNPDDLPAFISKVIEEVREGAHSKSA